MSRNEKIMDWLISIAKEIREEEGYLPFEKNELESFIRRMEKRDNLEPLTNDEVQNLMDKHS